MIEPLSSMIEPALSVLREVLSSVEFWKLAAPAFSAIVAWLVNEWRKRLWEEYKRKEDSYTELLRCLRGFYMGQHHSLELQDEFINQLNRCWLYCPDHVILEAYSFLGKVNKSNGASDPEKLKAIGDLASIIRKDLISRKLVKKTKLTGQDFKHVEALKT